jgi:hypothetical protein
MLKFSSDKESPEASRRLKGVGMEQKKSFMTAGVNRLDFMVSAEQEGGKNGEEGRGSGEK